MKGKKVKEKEVVQNGIGDEIHVFDTPNGEVRVKSIRPGDYIYTGEQWCPDCHIQMIDKGYVFECPQCGTETDKELAEEGLGYPTLESTYENDYGEYYQDDSVLNWEDL